MQIKQGFLSAWDKHFLHPCWALESCSVSVQILAAQQDNTDVFRSHECTHNQNTHTASAMGLKHDIDAKNGTNAGTNPIFHSQSVLRLAICKWIKRMRQVSNYPISVISLVSFCSAFLWIRFCLCFGCFDIPDICVFGWKWGWCYSHRYRFSGCLTGWTLGSQTQM